jgi:hypothetical protein
MAFQIFDLGEIIYLLLFKNSLDIVIDLVGPCFSTWSVGSNKKSDGLNFKNFVGFLMERELYLPIALVWLIGSIAFSCIACLT